VLNPYLYGFLTYFIGMLVPLFLKAEI